jgi:hypothetical protein
MICRLLPTSSSPWYISFHWFQMSVIWQSRLLVTYRLSPYWLYKDFSIDDLPVAPKLIQELANNDPFEYMCFFLPVNLLPLRYLPANYQPGRISPKTTIDNTGVILRRHSCRTGRSIVDPHANTSYKWVPKKYVYPSHRVLVVFFGLLSILTRVFRSLSVLSGPPSFPNRSLLYLLRLTDRRRVGVV